MFSWLILVTRQYEFVRSRRETYSRPAPALALTAGAWAAGAPRQLGSEHQLSVDDYLIESMEHVRRVIHPVTKHEDNPILLPVQPWQGQYTLLYGTVLRDEQEGIWKMWCSTMNHFRYIQNIFPESTYLCYATSKDGVRWKKPALSVAVTEAARKITSCSKARTRPSSVSRAYWIRSAY
jgi:hypothetical protein